MPAAAAVPIGPMIFQFLYHGVSSFFVSCGSSFCSGSGCGPFPELGLPFPLGCWLVTCVFTNKGWLFKELFGAPGVSELISFGVLPLRNGFCMSLSCKGLFFLRF